MGVRVEVASSGFDESLQGLTSDPYAGSIPGSTGLRIPSLRQDDTTRYTFLLCSRTISKPTRLRGIRQRLELGFTVTTVEGEEPSNIQTFTHAVQDSTFSAPDGNVSWHLVLEPNPRPKPTVPGAATLGCIESHNFRYCQSDGPALLFDTPTTFGAQTAYYTQGMTAYTPPVIATSEWEPIAALGNLHDIRFPWDSSHAWDSLDVPLCVVGERRVSLYASVLQTAGLPTYLSTPIGTTPADWGSEYNFAQLANGINAAATSGVTASAVIFWKIAGAIIFEDYDCGCNCSVRGA